MLPASAARQLRVDLSSSVGLRWAACARHERCSSIALSQAPISMRQLLSACPLCSCCPWLCMHKVFVLLVWVALCAAPLRCSKSPLVPQMSISGLCASLFLDGLSPAEHVGFRLTTSCICLYSFLLSRCHEGRLSCMFPAAFVETLAGSILLAYPVHANSVLRCGCADLLPARGACDKSISEVYTFDHYAVCNLCVVVGFWCTASGLARMDNCDRCSAKSKQHAFTEHDETGASQKSEARPGRKHESFAGTSEVVHCQCVSDTIVCPCANPVLSCMHAYAQQRHGPFDTVLT